MQVETRATTSPGMPMSARSHRLRWREPPLRQREAWLVWLLVVVLHGVLAVLVWLAMRPPAAVTSSSRPVPDDMFEVRFLPALAAPAAKAPPPVPPSLSRAPSSPVSEPLAKHARPVQRPVPASSVAPSPRLFDRNGQVILPAAAASVRLPEYVQRLPLGDTRIMRHDSPVRYRATRFAKDWRSGGGSAIDDALQKVVDKTTVKHTFHLPNGIHIHCGISLAMLAGGCGGDPPPPPSRKDGDVRLNMAPAPLAPNPHAAKPPALSECIALYRAGKPLVDGCPSDTPVRAVDAELRERREKTVPEH